MCSCLTPPPPPPPTPTISAPPLDLRVDLEAPTPVVQQEGAVAVDSSFEELEDVGYGALKAAPAAFGGAAAFATGASDLDSRLYSGLDFDVNIDAAGNVVSKQSTLRRRFNQQRSPRPPAPGDVADADGALAAGGDDEPDVAAAHHDDTVASFAPPPEPERPQAPTVDPAVAKKVEDKIRQLSELLVQYKAKVRSALVGAAHIARA